MTTLERAATALADSLATTRPGDATGDLPTFAVIAVLKALREPSEAMLLTACATHKPGQPMKGSDRECSRQVNARRRWQAMLDTIIEGRG